MDKKGEDNMCQFVGWKEYEGNVYFLTNADLNTKEGKKLLLPEVKEDLCGHGAIENYYPELKGKGVNMECTDFSTSDNFPKEIAEAIKQGKLSRIGICFDVLNNLGKKEYEKAKQQALVEYKKITQSAWAEYKKIKQPALAEYKKIKQQALVEYKKITQPAWAEYNKTIQPALAEYEKTEQPAWEEYEKIKLPAWEEYEKIKQPALTEYKKIVQPAWAEYEKRTQPALAEYEKTEQPALVEYEETIQQAFSNIIKQKKYRKDNWR